MTDRKPNVLFMLNDHQAYYRHGWDGGLKPARPHFDRAYTVCPLCTPARLDPLRLAGATGKAVQDAVLFLNKIGAEELRRLIRAGDVLKTLAYVQDRLLDG
jgi:hypothetical protein